MAVQVTPKTDGLCRECHMVIHGSTPRGEPASVGEIAKAIDELADESYLPAFLQWKLHSLVTDKVEMRARGINHEATPLLWR